MEQNNATEANAGAIAPQEEVKVLPPTEEDLEAKVKALEEEKARLVEERANYQAAYLKEKSKAQYDPNEDDEDKFRRIAREELANTRLLEVDREREAILQKALRENKELKLAHLNKTNTPPATMGTHSESQPVRDAVLSPSTIAHFKQIGKTDKWIENYKKNLQKNSGRVA